MLDEVLAVVRELTDVAIDNEQHRHANTLSQLASKLEFALRNQREGDESFIEREKLDERYRHWVAELCGIAREHLDDDDYPVFAGVLEASIPAPRDADPNIDRLIRECDQVKAMFDAAVAAKSVGDIKRAVQLLVLKQKSVVRAKMDAGLIVDEDTLPPLYIPLVDAVISAGVLIGEEQYDRILDAVFAIKQTEEYLGD